MVKKIICTSLIAVLFLCTCLYAQDTGVSEMRQKFLTQSQDLRSNMKKTNDVVLISSMWDSCLISITQLDAYVYMIDIFNAIEKANLTVGPIDNLIAWLNEIKKTNDVNIKSLKAVTTVADQDTRVFMNKLSRLFGELNGLVGSESKRLASLKKSVSR